MAAPTEVPVTQLSLSAQQREWLDRASAQVEAQ